MKTTKHYVLKGFSPRLDADVSTDKKGTTILVWVNYNPNSSGQMQVIFSRECNDEAEALDIMSSFGHGFEYTGAHWEEV